MNPDFIFDSAEKSEKNFLSRAAMFQQLLFYLKMKIFSQKSKPRAKLNYITGPMRKLANFLL